MEEDEITQKIIGCAFEVSNALGVGFLEKVYENALFVELSRSGFQVEQQKPIKVEYKGAIVGDYFADLLVENTIILEIKSAKAIEDIYQAQLLNYLKATGLHTGLLLNFGTPKLGIKRMVF